MRSGDDQALSGCAAEQRAARRDDVCGARLDRHHPVGVLDVQLVNDDIGKVERDGLGLTELDRELPRRVTWGRQQPHAGSNVQPTFDQLHETGMLEWRQLFARDPCDGLWHRGERRLVGPELPFEAGDQMACVPEARPSVDAETADMIEMTVGQDDHLDIIDRDTLLAECDLQPSAAATQGMLVRPDPGVDQDHALAREHEQAVVRAADAVCATDRRGKFVGGRCRKDHVGRQRSNTVDDQAALERAGAECPPHELSLGRSERANEEHGLAARASARSCARMIETTTSPTTRGCTHD